MRLGSLILLAAGAAQPAVDPDTARGFDHFYNLEFDQAIGVFRRLTKNRPGSPYAFNHLAQSILYREMFRAGALESELVSGGNAFLRREKMNPSPADVREFDGSIGEAMRLSQALLAQNPEDKAGLYCLGIAHGLRGNYNFLVRKSWLDALRDASASRTLHNRLSQVDPAMTDARLVQGIHEYVVGSLPWYYRTLGFVAGFRGDKENGIRTLKLVHEKGEANRADAAVLLATVYRREKRPGDAVPLLEGLIRQYPRNYLLGLELAQMYSDLGNSVKALDAVAAVERQNVAPAQKVLYYRATIQFWYREYDAALANFLQVTSKADTLDPNTGVTAWMRLGQTYDLKDDRAKALEAYRKCMAYAPGSYRAKEAQRYLRSRYRR